MWCNISFTLLLLFTKLFPSFQYNLDLETYKQHYGNSGSMFGFSLALHKYFNKNWVIVGAPKTHHSYNLTGVERSGAVYRCDLQETNRCILIPFDSKGNQFNDRKEQVDTKSNQWLGATLSSGGENGPIVACAPRYVFHTMQPSKVARIEPVGTCFAATNNFTVITEYSPCRTNYWGYHRQGSCQAGFSAAISKSGNRLFIGAPGSWYWQGQIYSIHPDATFPYKPPPYQDFGTGGQTYSFDVMDRRTIVYSTRESYSNDDDSYLGYSMISGDFNGDEEEDVAVGMPRGASLLGKVVIYRWNMDNQLNITGKQIGAYFGYSLSSSDIDGDKLDDLIVGAPMYTEENNEGKYDVGRVYIMLQGKQAKFDRIFVRDGVKARSRFGTAVTNLGDINQDGFGDFAVGAPYDGLFGRGSVYIYHGSKNGPLEKYSQVIHAEDIIGDNYPRTFGFSLAGGIDMDGNLYPDLAVGAYDSDTVFVFKSRPVAVVDATTQFKSSNKLINLDNRKCVKQKDGSKVACIEIESCLKYDGVNLPQFLNFDVSWILDTKKIKRPRLFFIETDGKNVQNTTIKLEFGKTFCFKQMVYVVSNIRDKLTPLEVEMRYQLHEDIQSQMQRKRRNILSPVIDKNREITHRDSLNIQKNCGLDNVCIPDLQLNIKSKDKFLLGSKVPLEIEVLITNNGEDAFESSFFMTIPSDINFKKIQQIGTSKDTPITCSAPRLNTNYTLRCDLGNPFIAGKVINFKIIMLPSPQAHITPTYDFYMEANSTNLEREGSSFDNVIKKSIHVWIETDVVIEGLSHPDVEHYKASRFKNFEDATSESDLGPHFVHIYNVRNNGPSMVDEAIFYLHWPYQTLGGKNLMYVMNKPETQGNIMCDQNPLINFKNLDYEISLSSKSYLESIGVMKTPSSFSSNHVIHIHDTQSLPPNRGIYSNKKVLTENEKRMLKEEEILESTGDASLMHNRRAQSSSHLNNKSHISNPWSSSWNPSGIVKNSTSRTMLGNKTVGYNNGDELEAIDEKIEYYSNITKKDVNPIPELSLYHSETREYITPISSTVDKNNIAMNNQFFHDNGDNIFAQKFYSNSDNNVKYHDSFVHSSNNFEDYKYNDIETPNRSRRQNSNFSYKNIEVCEIAKCAVLRCVISNLGNGDEAWIAIRARLVAKTLESLAENVPINISTLAITQVTKLPYIGTPSENIIKSHEVYFQTIPEPISPPDTVPLWVVVLSACVGTILLLILILMLYKCGFFKRNRPTSNPQERQPLNSRNGYHGDEHL